jgi:hypothetical protein
VLLIWLLVAPLAVAQARRVLVVIDRTSPGVLARLRRELAGMGLEVVVSGQDQDLRASAAIGDLVKRSQGAAVLRLRPGRGLIEVAVTDAAGALVQHEQPLADAEIQRDDGVVALRMAELLRASLLEAQTPLAAPPASSSAAPHAAIPGDAPTASPADTATPATSAHARPETPAVPIPPPAPRASQAFAMRAGPSVLVSPGGLGPMLHGKVGAAWATGARGRLGLDLLVPLGPSRLEATGGRLSIYTSLLSVNGLLLVTSRDAPLSGGVGAALGLLWGSFAGEASAHYEARRTQTLAVVPQIRAEVSYAVGEGWRLWGEAAAGRSLSPLSLRLPGQADIAWGNLIGTGALGLELGF